MKINEIKTEEKVRLDPKCWTGKKIGNPKTKVKGGVRVNNCVTAESVNEDADLRKLQQQWWVALPAIMKKAGIDYHPVKELSRDYYPTLGWITIPGERFTTFDVNANPKGDGAKLNISVDVDTSNEFYRTAQPERAAKLNAVAEKIAQALGGTAAEHMTGQRRNHPGVSRITATMTLPKEPAEWQNPSRSYDPRARFLNTPGERARQGRVARSAYSDTFGGDASNYRLEGVAEGSEQQWVVTVGTKTGGTSHTMTFSGTKEQAIKKAVARFGTSKNPVVTAKPKQQGVTEGDLTEFAPGNGGGESGRWYTDDQMTDIVGDGWWNDLDVSGDISKQQMIQEAQAWLNDQGYRVQVLNCKLNDDDMEWYIEGSFRNTGFAKKGMAEDFNAEYDDEAGMADNNLETLERAVDGIDELINAGDNLPEWCQEKIAVAKSMLVAVWDYMESADDAEEEEDPEIAEMYEALEELAEELAVKKNTSTEAIWESLESMDDKKLYETAAWRRKAGKNKNGGLNAKGVASYRRENPGSKLQTAVTTKPSKLKPGSKAAKRRKSFCARMGGVKGPMKKPNGKPTRKALALRKWNC